MAKLESRWMLVLVVLGFILVGVLLLMLASMEVSRGPMQVETHSAVTAQ